MKSIDIIYERLESGKTYDLDYKPYKKEILLEVLNFFETQEEFEKCKFILNILNKLDHDKGYCN
jgi:hypothetical protein